MSADRVQRRLAAIVAVDVVGYSKMMGRDEAGTLVRLKQLRAQFLHPNAQEHGGRIVKTTGDGTLVEFPSAFDAVSHAVDVQRGMADRNSGLPEAEQIHLRFGINVGDVLSTRTISTVTASTWRPGSRRWPIPEAFACRRESTTMYAIGLTSPTRIWASAPLKNIAEPVRIYRVRLSESHPTGRTDRPAAPPLPDKPSIAVLPFVNMSGDPEQEYFADGITEDLITNLSHIRWFFVIARNSCFAYKGRSPDIRTVARELGVAYVLEGSVRKAGSRVRITAQLADGASGNHVWAQRYDRELQDIFAVQDEITGTLAGAIEPELGKAERERARAKRPDDLHAWDLYQRGLWHTYKRTREDLAEAQRLFRQALERDPGLARAYAAAEEAFFFQWVGGYADKSYAAKGDALLLAQKAVQLDGQDAFNRYALGRALILMRQHDSAVFELRKAIELDPSFAQAHYALAMALATGGHPQEALPHIELAMRLSPQDPYFGQFLVRRAEACFFLGRLEEAVQAAESSLREPNVQWSRWAILAAAQAHLGRLPQARASVEALHQMRPDIDFEFVRDYWPIADANAIDYLMDGLQKAGLRPSQ